MCKGGAHPWKWRTQTGTFDVASGATLQLSGGTHDFNGGSITSSGVLLINGGTVNMNVPYNIEGTTHLSDGVLNLSAPSSTGKFIQSGGSLQGDSTFTVTNGATIGVAGIIILLLQE